MGNRKWNIIFDVKYLIPILGSDMQSTELVAFVERAAFQLDKLELPDYNFIDFRATNNELDTQSFIVFILLILVRMIFLPLGFHLV